MMNKGKIISVIAAIVLVLGIAAAWWFITARYNFNITQVSWTGETTFWTDNTNYNKYDIKLKSFDGTDLKEINSKKDEYKIIVNSSVENGELRIKIYNDKKVIFEKDGQINETINVSKDDSKGIKIELTGKKATNGHVNIKLK